MARGGAGTIVGWLKFKVGADSSEFDSKIKSFKNKMEEADVKAKNLEKDMSDTKEIISNMTNLLNQLNNGLLTEEQIIEKVNYLSKNGFDISYNGNIEETTEQLKQITEFYLPGFQAQLQEQEEQYEKINKQADLYKMKIKEAESEHYKLGDITKRSLDSIGNSVEGVIKKFVKWGLAVVGIRSVMSLIRRSMSTLSQYDNQLSSNLEYIRWALAQALKPIVEWIMKAIVTIIRLVNTLIYRLFGVNLLADATPEKFKKAKDQLSKAKDEAKELKKELAGFDEMNILGDNTKASKDTISTDLPSFDLSKLFTDKELDELWEKIKKKVDDVIDYIIKKIEEWKKNNSFTKGIADFIDIGLGILNPNVEQNVVQAGVDVGAFFIEGFKERISEKPTAEQEVIEKILNPMKEKMEKFFIEKPVEIVLTVNKIIDFCNDIKKQIADFFVKNAIDIVLNKASLAFSIIKPGLSSLITGANSFLKNNPLNIDISKIISAFTGLPGKAKEAWKGIKNAFGGVDSFFKTTFSDAWQGVLKVFNKNGTIFVGIKEAITNVFKKAVNGIFDGIDKVINKPFEEINGVFNSIRSTNVLGVKPFSFIKKNMIPTVKLPKLATGGIINMPGRGVALGGELGPEGVIPMTNKSAMELLGRTIGEYVTINANITNNMNGRLISRVLREVNSQQDFLYNR